MTVTMQCSAVRCGKCRTEHGKFVIYIHRSLSLFYPHPIPSHLRGKAKGGKEGGGVERTDERACDRARARARDDAVLSCPVLPYIRPWLAYIPHITIIIVRTKRDSEKKREEERRKKKEREGKKYIYIYKYKYPK